ncbi:Sir2 family NAD-dependent protein deacetylase [Seleniivibrio sp.]|uniref:SIR2 family NAD-dependent protein deacylase n=1 Tax=Seleniivibrio sp. TaxID=2898801 RepID=UPI0025ED06F0|nr:Sir2 family NAD-dependent protein deacetylase [Seleniivibrio sp.]MCD8552949.1 iron dicitrate transport regulator FecR [Seleniivibrio sp.]
MLKSVMYDELKDLINNSKTCLFLTGAGMSADSGIPTFRDRDGYWRNFPVFKDKGLLPQELASPASFRKQPHHSWAFYEWRRRNARKNTPHKGYEVINRMVTDVFGSSFVHTTNTDGYHIISGLPADRVTEIHGSMWRLQCMNGASCRYGVRHNTDVPLLEMDESTMSALTMPKCPVCGDLLRPNILMFNDWEYIENEIQLNHFESFLEKHRRVDLIFLIGSSSQIPTNDYIAKRLKQHGSRIVTINPDPSSARVCTPDIFIKERALPAFEAIEKILNSF